MANKRKAGLQLRVVWDTEREQWKATMKHRGQDYGEVRYGNTMVEAIENLNDRLHRYKEFYFPE